MKIKQFILFLVLIIVLIAYALIYSNYYKDMSLENWVKSQGGSIGKYYPAWVEDLPPFLEVFKEVNVISYGVSLSNIESSLDISYLSNNKKIVSLDLSFTQMKNVSVVETLGSLSTLNLQGVPIKDYIDSISKLENLTYLHLGNMGWKKQPNSKVHLVKLNSPLEDITPLKQLINLNYLNLDGSNISNIDTLVHLKKLKLLSINHTNLNFTQIQSLQEALPKCKILFNSGVVFKNDFE
ncbi:MAG: hypothetical protein NE330_06095 [Lentisphaeraceae bacterium]|nr:hypothetical protein [Lentisphaeraceae bacterium]